MYYSIDVARELTEARTAGRLNETADLLLLQEYARSSPHKGKAPSQVIQARNRQAQRRRRRKLEAMAMGATQATHKAGDSVRCPDGEVRTIDTTEGGLALFWDTSKGAPITYALCDLTPAGLLAIVVASKPGEDLYHAVFDYLDLLPVGAHPALESALEAYEKALVGVK